MVFDIKRFDVYRKIPKDLTQPTLAGALVSIFSALFIVFLLLSEFKGFIVPDVVSELYVDNPGEVERLQVRVNISLPRLSCQVVGLDIQDDMGRHEVGYVGNTQKIPINSNKGCQFETEFSINKVPGNFHVSTHAAGAAQPTTPDFAHVIHEVAFGDDISNKSVSGAFNPLAGRDKGKAKPELSHDYYMKVVPTVYEDLWGEQKISYQYTYAYKEYTSYGHGHRVLPAIWFRYDISPITVKYHEKRAPFYTFITTEYASYGHGRRVLPAIWFRYEISAITVKYHEKRPPIYTFITTICAIVGGTFTVAGIIDSFIYTAAEVFKKAELGKLH